MLAKNAKRLMLGMLTALAVGITSSAQASLTLSVKVDSNTTLSIAGTEVHLAPNGTDTSNPTLGTVSDFVLQGTKVDSNGFIYLNETGGLVALGAGGSAPAAKDFTFALRLEVKENSPGGAIAQLMDVTTDLRNNGSSGGGQKVLTIVAMQDGYTSPTGIVLTEGQLSGTLGNNSSPVGLAGTVTQTGNPGTLGVSGLSLVKNQSGTVTKDSASYNLNVNPAYTITSTLVITTQPTEDDSNLTSTIMVKSALSPVPEPATTTLALSGLAAFGLMGLRRIRRCETTTA